MTNVIDWTKYGRCPKREQPEIEVVYSGDGQRIWCTAKFPIERYADLKEMIERQIQHWERERD